MMVAYDTFVWWCIGVWLLSCVMVEQCSVARAFAMSTGVSV